MYSQHGGFFYFSKTDYICVMATQSSFDRETLFELITSIKGWNKGGKSATGEIIPEYCDSNEARVIKHRHSKGKLAQESYDNLFFHFGYKKELIYTKAQPYDFS